jgi:hypothetical protein
MSYTYKDIQSWGNVSAMDQAGNYKITSFTQIRYTTNTVQQIKSLLENGTPVIFAMNGNVFGTSFKDGNKVVSAMEYTYLTTNHAQCIVGYDNNKSDDGEQGAFKVANSWGTGFGEGGYYWITYAAIDEIGSGGWGGSFAYMQLATAPVKATLLIDINTTGKLPMKCTIILYLKDADNKTVMSKTMTYNTGNKRMLPGEIHYDISEFNSKYRSGGYHVFVYLSTGQYKELGQVTVRTLG